MTGCTEEVERQFRNQIREQEMLPFSPDEEFSVLVAYSGGADSSALLFLMRRFLEEEYPKTGRLYAVHVHHGIRGEEADRDLAFCQKQAEANHIPFFSFRVDVPSRARAEKKGIEETAREVRYEIFETLCRTHGISRVATAHNATDNLETVLFHLTRGSGSEGLCGIPAVRLPYIRPLLTIPKDMILSFCEENGIPFVTDSTNDDPAYARNYIRHEILPRLKTLNPSLEQTVSHTCAILKQDQAYWDTECERRPFPQTRESLLSLPPSLVSRILIREYEKAGGMYPLSYRQVRHLQDALSAEDSAGIALPCHLSFRIQNGTVFFEKRRKTEKTVYTYEVSHSPAPGTVLTIPEDDAVFLFAPGASDPESQKKVLKLKNIYKLSIYTYLSSDKINGNLSIRTREDGDTYRKRRMKRRVKKELQTAGLSPKDRETLPFLCDEEGILWIPGIGTEDRVNPHLTRQSRNKNIKIWYFKGRKNYEKEYSE